MKTQVLTYFLILTSLFSLSTLSVLSFLIPCYGHTEHFLVVVCLASTPLLMLVSML